MNSKPGKSIIYLVFAALAAALAVLLLFEDRITVRCDSAQYRRAGRYVWVSRG